MPQGCDDCPGEAVCGSQGREGRIRCLYWRSSRLYQLIRKVTLTAALSANVFYGAGHALPHCHLGAGRGCTAASRLCSDCRRYQITGGVHEGVAQWDVRFGPATVEEAYGHRWLRAKVCWFSDNLDDPCLGQCCQTLAEVVL